MKRIALFLAGLSAAGAAAAQEAPICTDRPAKANAACTVPAGRFQTETSAIGWSLSKVGGSRSEVTTLGASAAKIGLGERSDLQIGFTPLVRVTNRAAGSAERLSGFGDIVVRLKHRLSGDDAAVQVAVIPFVKLPTARRGLGNGEVEGGIAVPVSFALAGSTTMTLGPEVGLLADADGSGRHASVTNLVNLSLPLAPRLTGAVELWSLINFDPAGTIEQASADAALAYALSDTMQLDAGANVGLTRATADLELYAGVSIRF
jgi:hypothetical protein